MSYVKILSIVACVAFGPNCQGQVPDDLRDNRPDIGIVSEEQCPPEKGDVLVVYSASWCGPCQASRPQWATLRGQGYKVVYVDIDKPHGLDGKWDYQTPEIIAKAMETPPRVVPTLRYYNTDTGELLETTLTGMQSLDKVKEALWKPSSSTGLVPELRR